MTIGARCGMCEQDADGTMGVTLWARGAAKNISQGLKPNIYFLAFHVRAEARTLQGAAARI